MQIFNYIYYRITKLYYKWDGRAGGTAIVLISFVQVMILIDIATITMRLFYEREDTQSFVSVGKWVITIVFATTVMLNYKKYNGTYNKYRFLWKDETRNQRLIRGFAIILFLLLPLIPAVYVGFYW